MPCFTSRLLFIFALALLECLSLRSFTAFFLGLFLLAKKRQYSPLIMRKPLYFMESLPRRGVGVRFACRSAKPANPLLSPSVFTPYARKDLRVPCFTSRLLFIFALALLECLSLRSFTAFRYYTFFGDKSQVQFFSTRKMRFVH